MRIDFSQIFALVARIETVITVLALAAQMEVLVYQLDVKLAFLNRDLKEEVYIEQPLGYTLKGKGSKIMQLKNVLYGLKQAP